MAQNLQNEKSETIILKVFKKKSLKRVHDGCQNEAVILSLLKHERVPELKGVIHNKELFGFMLEYKTGETLSDFLFKEKRALTMNHVIILYEQLIDIVGMIHSRGIVHRDIRCPNIIVNNDKIHLIDFGLARMVNDTTDNYQADYFYLGEILLYMIYSKFTKRPVKKNLPWYEELSLTPGQILHIKRLFRMEPVFLSTEEMIQDFHIHFKKDQRITPS